MNAPFIFIATHRIKPGKREAAKAYFAAFSSETVEPQEPRLLSFYGYSAPDSDILTVVQVHPDADSMATHMKVGAEHFGQAYAEYLEPKTSIQIYGTLSPELVETISAAAMSDSDDDSVTLREPFTGFDRLPR